MKKLPNKSKVVTVRLELVQIGMLSDMADGDSRKKSELVRRAIEVLYNQWAAKKESEEVENG